MSDFQCHCSSKLYRKQNFQALKTNVNCVTFAERLPAGVQRKLLLYPCGGQAALVAYLLTYFDCVACVSCVIKVVRVASTACAALSGN